MTQSITIESNWKPFILAGAVSCLVFLIYSIVTMILLITLGGQPETVQECFSLLQKNKIIGLIRLDILTILIMPLYLIIFYALYGTMKKSKEPAIQFWTILTFIGIILTLATPSAYSLINLSNKYEIATDPVIKNQLIAAAEALRASDMFNMTGAILGGIFIQIGALAISILMLKNTIYSKTIAIIGIITHTLDLSHIILGFVNSQLGTIIMAIAGPLYLIWFPMIGIKFVKIYKNQ